jgi:hypothetical protein
VEQAMSLVTQPLTSYNEFASPQDFEAGWTEVRRGLNGILLGYLLLLVMVGLTVGAGVFVGMAMLSPRSFVSPELLAKFLLACGGVQFLIFLGAMALLVCGKWRCLAHAPERCGAKWWMFASILCLMAGPVLNFITPLVASDSPMNTEVNGAQACKLIAGEMVNYRSLGRDTSSAARMRLAGSAVNILSTVFFVLFLHATARCFRSGLARFAELLLVVVVLLLGLLGMLLFNGSRMGPPPELLLVLGVGGLAFGAGYLLLIVGMSFRIAASLERFRR